MADDYTSRDLPGRATRPPSPDETVTLLERIQCGDDEALNALLARVLPRLRRWAHGRLPVVARSMLDTGDIVQVVAAKAVRQLARLDLQERSSLAWYLRQAIRNEIATQWRRAGRTPIKTTLGDALPANQTSPLEQLLGAERVAHYEAALNQLDAGDRDAIVGRFELAYDYEELAHYLGKASAATARVAVHRAVKRLAEQARELHRTRQPGSA